MKHRALCLLLAVCMLLALTACGPRGGERQPAAPAEKYTLKNETLVDDELCLVRIDGVTEDEWTLAFQISCENRSETRALGFSVYDFSINGCMIDPIWAQMADPETGFQSEISFMPPPYEEVGGDAADEISFVLVVRDVDDLLAAPYVEAPFTLYPTGLSPDEVAYPARRTDPLEQVMVDDDGLSFVLFAFGGDGLDGYLENRTDRALTFELTDVRMDGRPLEPLWTGAIPAGKRAYVRIPFDLDGLDDGAVANAQAVAFTLRAYEDRDDAAPREYAVYEELVYVPRAYGEGPAASERAVS